MDSVVFIDANIFLEIFLKDTKSEQCKTFLRSLTEKNTIAITTDFIIYTCLIQVQNKLKDTAALKKVILFFNSLPPLRIVRPSLEEMYTAIECMEQYKLDFDDSLVVTCMKYHKITNLISLDKHFDKVKEIKRVSF